MEANGQNPPENLENALKASSGIICLNFSQTEPGKIKVLVENYEQLPIPVISFKKEKDS